MRLLLSVVNFETTSHRVMVDSWGTVGYITLSLLPYLIRKSGAVPSQTIQQYMGLLPRIIDLNQSYPVTTRRIHCDGYTVHSNPSNYGGGWVVLIEGNNEPEVHRTISATLYKKITNNETELRAMMSACKIANCGDTIVTDSRTIFYWLRNGKSKTRPDLNKFILEAKRMVNDKSLRIDVLGRDDNLAGNYIEFVLQG